MKKRVLLSSIATIALCLCLIAGSTFALFTDSSDFNIAVTSGNVEILSWAEIDAVYSARGPVAEHDDKYLKDENGAYYEHVSQTVEKDADGKGIKGMFTNGGSAEIDAVNLVINKITPGDKVDIVINTQNKGDVAFRYRYTIEVFEEKGLETGMVLTTHNDEEYEAVKSFTSEWFDMVTVNSDGTTAPADLSKRISLELPVYAGNEYQSETDDQPEDNRLAGEKSVTYRIRVEAVQANAVVVNNTSVVLYPTNSALQLAVENGGEISLDGETVNIESAFLAADKELIFTDGTYNGANIPSTTEAGMTNWVICNSDDEQGTFSTKITVADGATIVAPNGSDYDKHAIFLFGKSHELRIEKGAKIVANSSKAYSSCVQVCYSSVDIYLDDVSSLVYDKNAGAYGILLTAAGGCNIIVPDEAVKAEVEALIADPTSNFIGGDGTVVTVTVAQ